MFVVLRHESGYTTGAWFNDQDELSDYLCKLPHWTLDHIHEY